MDELQQIYPKVFLEEKQVCENFNNMGYQYQ